MYVCVLFVIAQDAVGRSASVMIEEQMAAVATDALPIPDAESVDDENSLGEEGSEEEDDDPPPRLRRSSLSLRSISRCGVVVVVAGRAPFSSRDTRCCLRPSQRPHPPRPPDPHTHTHSPQQPEQVQQDDGHRGRGAGRRGGRDLQGP